MISGLAHVCLNVKDLNRSLQYYIKLGFKPKFQFTPNGSLYGVYLHVGKNNYIEMFENKEMDTPSVNTVLHTSVLLLKISIRLLRCQKKEISSILKRKGV
jgi:predicted lactoylglutathione lyase